MKSRLFRAIPGGKGGGEVRLILSDLLMLGKERRWIGNYWPSGVKCAACLRLLRVI